MTDKRCNAFNFDLKEVLPFRAQTRTIFSSTDSFIRNMFLYRDEGKLINSAQALTSHNEAKPILNINSFDDFHLKLKNEWTESIGEESIGATIFYAGYKLYIGEDDYGKFTISYLDMYSRISFNTLALAKESAPHFAKSVLLNMFNRIK